jgi:hypothetical protein
VLASVRAELRILSAGFRGRVSFADRIYRFERGNHGVEHWSLWLDFEIMR